jgi:MOSC domain-containing protein YiiM
VRSAIGKLPVAGEVVVRTLNVDGDRQADLVNHGGRDQAVYVYAAEDYAYWEGELDRELPNHGWFGENFTVQGASSESVRIGDIWEIGSARFCVTSPRSPCFKLDHKMGLPRFAAKFRRSGRVGFYLRVLQEGAVTAGDEVRLVERAQQSITVRGISDLRHYKGAPADEADRAANVEALPESWRAYARKRLREARARDETPARDEAPARDRAHAAALEPRR